MVRCWENIVVRPASACRRYWPSVVIHHEVPIAYVCFAYNQGKEGWSFMSYAVNPISPTHSVSKYRPRKIRDQSEFIEQIARCTRISIHRNFENPPGGDDAPADSELPTTEVAGFC